MGHPIICLSPISVSSMSPAAGPLTVITPNLTNPSRLRESSPAHPSTSSATAVAATEYKPRNPLLAKSAGKPAAMANHVQKSTSSNNSISSRDDIQCCCEIHVSDKKICNTDPIVCTVTTDNPTTVTVVGSPMRLFLKGKSLDRVTIAFSFPSNVSVSVTLIGPV